MSRTSVRIARYWQARIGMIRARARAPLRGLAHWLSASFPRTHRNSGECKGLMRSCGALLTV